MTTLLVIGIHESAKFNNVIVAIKLMVIFLFIVFGVFFHQIRQWIPFIPPNTGPLG